MVRAEGFSYKTIYILGAIVFLVTAWFSQGYNHFDEHFQVIEFAGLKLGLTTAANLPWEYGYMMRPAFQPGVVYLLYRIASLTGITDPFIISFIFRLFSASITFLSIHLMISVYAPQIKNQKLHYAFLLLSFFLWFIPYNAARFSSDTTSGIIFIIGLTYFYLSNKPKLLVYFITGFLLGISFITKYQVAFMILGFAAWLLFIHKSGFQRFLIFISGIILATAMGILIDRWFYGEWVLTSWNYLQQNILLDKASGFGTYPWWYYFEQVFLNAMPPLSLVYILAILLYIWYYPKDLLTWVIVPFLAVHFLVPHKEIRFLFPVIGFLPIMIIRSVEAMFKIKGYGLLEKRLIKISVKIFWYTSLVMLTILAFRPADDQISLYKKLWYTYSSPAKLYFTSENPYHRARVDVNFYKRKNLVFQHVDSLQTIVPSVDTITLIVTEKPGLTVDKRFTPVLIYSSLPPWVKRFNINHWIERTSFWYIYELGPHQNKDNPL